MRLLLLINVASESESCSGSMETRTWNYTLNWSVKERRGTQGVVRTISPSPSFQMAGVVPKTPQSVTTMVGTSSQTLRHL